MVKVMSSPRSGEVHSPRSPAPPRPAARRMRVGQLSVAVGLIVVGVLGAYWFAGRGEHRLAVAVLARDLRRGELVGRDDVVPVGITADAPVGAVRFAAAASMLVGHAAVADLAKGTVLSPAMVADGPVLGAGRAVVGVNLKAGEYPVATLRAGMTGMVVRAGKDGTGSVLVERAEVFAVSRAPVASGSTDLFVSLVVDEQAVPIVSSAAGVGEVRLAVVGT